MTPECEECKKLRERIGLTLHMEHEKLKEIVEVDLYLASKWEAHDPSFKRLVDRVRLTIYALEDALKKKVMEALKP